MTVSDTTFEALRLEVIKLSGRVALLEREVDFLLNSHPGPAYVDMPPQVDDYPEVVDLKRKGKIIEAIAAYRAKTNASLVAAKNYVDNLEV
jgi:ribosomal protein L7/L12